MACEICGRAKPRVRNAVCQQFAPRGCSQPTPEAKRKREAARIKQKRADPKYLAAERKRNSARMAKHRECRINQLDRYERDRKSQAARDKADPAARERRLEKKREYCRTYFRSAQGKAAKARWRAKNLDRKR